MGVLWYPRLMAMYHLRVKFVKRSEGRSSVAAAAYRSGERLTDEREGKTHDYTRKRDIEHKEVMLPDHMPAELSQREALWNAVETGIKRKDGQPAFEVEVALPRELDKEQCVQLVREFAHDHFVDNGLPVDFAIHRTPASDGQDHPHAHILISTRRFNADGTLAKVATDMQDNPALLRKVYALEQEGKLDDALLTAKGTKLMEWRKDWEDYSNRFLDNAGSSERIDHRTLAAQGVEGELAREPTPNIGITFYGRLREFQGSMADRVQHWKEVGFRNAMREQAQRIFEKRPDLNAEFIAHAREYCRHMFPELKHEPQPEQEIEYEQ